MSQAESGQTDTTGGPSTTSKPDVVESQNIVDEQKSNYGANSRADVDIGAKFPAPLVSTKSFGLPRVDSGGQSLLDSVDEALKGTVGGGQDKAHERTDEGFAIGSGADLHEKAAAKQP